MGTNQKRVTSYNLTGLTALHFSIMHYLCPPLPRERDTDKRNFQHVCFTPTFHISSFRVIKVYDRVALSSALTLSHHHLDHNFKLHQLHFMYVLFQPYWKLTLLLSEVSFSHTLSVYKIVTNSYHPSKIGEGKSTFQFFLFFHFFIWPSYSRTISLFCQIMASAK